MPLPIANAIPSASQFNWLNELDRSLGVYCCILEVILSDKAELQLSGILETEVMTWGLCHSSSVPQGIWATSEDLIKNFWRFKP